MAIGISINIGMNQVDRGFYGDPKILNGCESDAEAMAYIARNAGFQEPILLLSKQATKSAVTNAITQAAGRLNTGDILLLTFSGHGGQKHDDNQDEGIDTNDERWCLFDHDIIDDELFGLWIKFNEGVRILVFSDSCNSGTVAALFLNPMNPVRDNITKKSARSQNVYPEPAIKALATEESNEIFKNHKAEYQEIQRKFPKSIRSRVKASVLLISACQDWETAVDGFKNSVFTAALLKVWDSGNFKGNYIEFHHKIYEELKGTGQNPNYFPLTPNPAF
ncbi:MAG TPA: caspase family protein, partial [Pyrinomonadaceae bacterium]|nr:caspase family protein [Pyrinomonadaceae bacterium]